MSPGCARLVLRPGLYRESLTNQAVVRSYLLEVPDAARAGAALPLVLAFHGFDESGQWLESYTGLAAAALSRGVYVVLPDGVDGRWNFPRRAAVGPSDVAFVAALLARLRQSICYDPRRVVAAGFSDGADMANTLGCELPSITAVFGVAPSVYPAPCPRLAPTLIEVHGSADPIVPFDGGGGDRAYPFEGLEAQPVGERMARWAALGACRPTPQHAVASGVSARIWRCPSGHRLALYIIAGGGHTWPGAEPEPEFGATSTSVSATAAVLALAADPQRLPW